jgi:hypothetical protein
LVKFQLRLGKIESPPVPIDEILAFLGLRLEFDDIEKRFGISGHLGCLIVETRQIFIDQAIEDLGMVGRQNFTIAHEIAHWLLHQLILNPHLLPYAEKYWLERQADWFASFLLMPPGLILKAWKARVGYSGPLIITPEEEAIGIENFGTRHSFVMALADQHATDLALLFKVSREPMRLRLQELGLLPSIVG